MLFYCGNQWGYTPVGAVVPIPATFCNPPTNLVVSIYAQYATVQWVAPHGYLKFVLEYRIVGSPTWTAVDVFGQSHVLTLSPVTSYEWQVKTVCALTPLRESTYVSGPSFFTQNAVAGCTPVAAVQVIYLGNKYRFQWASTGAAFYTVEIKLVQAQTARTYITQTNSLDLSSFTPGETYMVRVIAQCQNTAQVAVPSPWTTWTVGNLSCPAVGTITQIHGTTSIMVAWQQVAPNLTYNIYLDDVPVMTAYPNTTWTFNGLIPNTSYNIKVFTNCGNGIAPFTEITVKTDPLVCNPPTNLQVVTASITPTGFDITWVPGAGIGSQQIILNNGTPISVAAAIATYSFTGLAAGSLNNVVVRSVCPANVSTDATVSQQLQGCPAVTGLVLTATPTGISASWDPVPNATKYRIEFFQVAPPTSISAWDTTITTNVGIGGLNPNTQYGVNVVAHCANGLVSANATANITTPVTGACVNAIIDNMVPQQNSIHIFTWHFADGRTTGFFEYELRKVSDNSHVAGGAMSTIGQIVFNFLDPLTAYKVYIWDRGVPSHDPPICTPTEITTVSTLAACLPPAAPASATMNATNTNITVAITASPSAPPFYSVAYAPFGTQAFIIINNVPLASFPYTITPVTPGRYRVQVASYCAPDNASNPTDLMACPTPINVQAVTVPTGVQVTWDPLAYVTKFIVYMTNQVTGVTSEYLVNTNFITITNLAAGVAYVGHVRAVCIDNLNIGKDSLPFNVTSGLRPPDGEGGGEGEGERTMCVDPVFTAYVQDCSVTDPGGIGGGGGGGGGVDGGGGGSGTANDCSVTAQDWALVNAIFADVADDAPNDTFLEATFEIAQSIAEGVLGALPGGIMGVIAAACLPASTATVTIGIVLGGQLEVGAGTYATNGNITVAGSYTSDGSTRLIVRLRGNYNKV